MSLLFVSCRSVSTMEMTPEGPLSKKLPSLEPQVDIYSVENAYTSAAYGVFKNSTQKIIPVSEVRPQNYRDPKMRDAIMLFERESTDNMLNASGEKKGYVVFSIRSGGPKKGGNFLGIVGVCTLWIPNLLGVPIGNHQAEFEVEVNVLEGSSKNRMLKTI